jgi:hypothetical protein
MKTPRLVTGAFLFVRTVRGRRAGRPPWEVYFVRAIFIKRSTVRQE